MKKHIGIQGQGLKLSLLLAAVLLWLVCVPAKADVVSVTVSGLYGQSEARSMLQMINDFRTGVYVDGGQSQPWALDPSGNVDTTSYVGLGTLEYDYELEKTAMQRALEVAVSFEHTRPNGGTCFTAFPSGYSSMGENITARTGDYTAKQAFDAWCETNDIYDYQGHRRNMLGSSFNRVGIAKVTVQADGFKVTYWVQNFGRRYDSYGLTKTSAENSTRSMSVQVEKSLITAARIRTAGELLMVPVLSSVELPKTVYQIRMNKTWPDPEDFPHFDYYATIDNACTVTSGNPQIASLSGSTLKGVAPGETTLTVTPPAAFSGSLSKSVAVRVTRLLFNNVSVTLPNGSYDYTGNAIEPKPVVTDKGTGAVLVEGKDYTVEYTDNVDAGTATVVVTGKGNYEQEQAATRPQFKILPLSLATARVDLAGLIANYNGKAHEPKPIVNLDGKLLELGKDYRLSYENNVNAGTAKVTVDGIGNYMSSRPTSFTIWPQVLTNAKVSVPDQIYTGKELKPAPTVTLDGTTLKNTDYTVTYENNTALGTAKVTVTGKGNYKEKAPAASFRINRIPIAAAKVTAENQTYNGKAKKPEPVVKLNGRTLEKGSDYTVAYKNNTKAGKATITVTGTGFYEGTATGSFKINNAYPGSAVTPLKTTGFAALEKNLKNYKSEKDYKSATFSILQAKGTGKSSSSVQLSWKKVTGASRYVIYGSVCSTGKKLKKVVALKSSRNSYTIKKLKKGTYYRYIVVAVNSSSKALAVSRTVHVATGGGKVGNPASVKLSTTSLTIGKGKTETVKATMKSGSKTVKKHRVLSWESDNIGIAKVSSTGKITGVNRGTCTVYAYTQSGVMAKVKVTVQ